MKFPKHYDHSIEPSIYDFWYKNNFFSPDNVNKDSKEKFCISMPPPNVTGVLHLWHAQTIAIEDTMVRFARMKWKKTLYIPWTDHAWIATQVVVEKKLAQEENKTRHNLGRVKFLEKVWEWVKYSRSTILSQIKTMWASCDWSREQFTLSERLSRAVRKSFKNLYEHKKIYKDQYIINWCPRCQTVLSDIEVNYEEEEWKLVYIKYFIVWKEDALTVATTRPETMFADVAIAVNPQDNRYKKFIWKNVYIPIVNREIPVIWDYDVDRTFGTWVLKITPTHDPADFEIAQRHGLPMDIFAIDKDWKLTEYAGKFKGLDANKTVESILKHLDDIGNLEKIEPYTHKVPKCSRCDTVIQPMVSNQWFVDIAESAKSAIKAVKQEEIKIVPNRFEKTFYSWLEEIRPWCISRQLRWGHRIPVWYCEKGHINVLGEEDIYNEYLQKSDKWNVFLDMIIFNLIADSRLANPFNIEQLVDILYEDSLVANEWKVWQSYIKAYKQRKIDQKFKKQLEEIEYLLNTVLEWDIDKIISAGERIAELLEESIFVEPDDDTYNFVLKCNQCWSDKLEQDPDMLDTWFSSALWPFTILWWPENTKDLQQFYPTTVLETGYDILFFWVARMIMMWYYNMKKDKSFSWKPFSYVYLHWLVRDEKWEKMSKSKWNVVDPLEIVKSYGADALRLTLIVWNTPWNDLKFSNKKVEYNKRFIDKLWNATRYIYNKLELDNIDNIDYDSLTQTLIDNQDKLNDFDLWIINQLNKLIKMLEDWMDKFYFGESIQSIQKFVWNKFCDWYLEISKHQTSQFTDTVLLYSIWTILKLLHPVIPFVTEKLWWMIWFEGALIVSAFPKPINIKTEKKNIELFVNIVTAIRSLKQESNIKPHQKVEVYIEQTKETDKLISSYWELIKKLTNWEKIIDKPTENLNFAMVDDIKVWVVLIDTNINYRQKLLELEKQLEEEEQFLQWIRKLLSSPWFMQNAKSEVIKQKQQKKEEVENKILKIKEEIAKIKLKLK